MSLIAPACRHTLDDRNFTVGTGKINRRRKSRRSRSYNNYVEFFHSLIILGF